MRLEAISEVIRRRLGEPGEPLPQNRQGRPLEDYNVYYEKDSGTYWIPDHWGLWTKVPESGVKRYLKVVHNVGAKQGNQQFSPMDGTLLDINTRYHVAYAGKLAGYRAGVYEQNGETILVTDSPRLVEPKEVSFKIISKFLNGLLETQRKYFDCWMKIAVEALMNQKIRSGQAVVFAGPKDCGKSVLQNQIITPLLGGRMAKPYQFMSGQTAFNGNLFEAEHLMIEDDIASCDIRARRQFGAHLKQFTANEGVQHHAKNRQARTLSPFWRISVSCNDEPENLMILPPIDDSLADKLMLFRAYRKAMPMPTESLEEREAFQWQIRTELPGYLYYLLKMKIPQERRAARYGVRTFQNPELFKRLNEIAPEYRLLELVDQCLFSETAETNLGKIKTSSGKIQPWKGNATKLKSILRDTNYSLRDQVNKLLYASNSCGTYLSRLVEKEPERVKASTINGDRRYTIYPPPSDKTS